MFLIHFLSNMSKALMSSCPLFQMTVSFSYLLSRINHLKNNAYVTLSSFCHLLTLGNRHSVCSLTLGFHSSGHGSTAYHKHLGKSHWICSGCLIPSFLTSTRHIIYTANWLGPLSWHTSAQSEDLPSGFPGFPYPFPVASFYTSFFNF